MLTKFTRFVWLERYFLGPPFLGVMWIALTGMWRTRGRSTVENGHKIVYGLYPSKTWRDSLSWFSHSSLSDWDLAMTGDNRAPQREGRDMAKTACVDWEIGPEGMWLLFLVGHTKKYVNWYQRWPALTMGDRGSRVSAESQGSKMQIMIVLVSAQLNTTRLIIFFSMQKHISSLSIFMTEKETSSLFFF